MDARSVRRQVHQPHDVRRAGEACVGGVVVGVLHSHQHRLAAGAPPPPPPPGLEKNPPPRPPPAGPPPLSGAPPPPRGRAARASPAGWSETHRTRPPRTGGLRPVAGSATAPQ